MRGDNTGKVAQPSTQGSASPQKGAQGLGAQLVIDAPCDFINSNQRLHRMQTAKLTKTWRQAGAEAAQGQDPITGQVHILAHISKPRGGRWDPNNLWPTIKACVDGVVDSGLLQDDDWTHVIGPDMRRGPKGPACVVLEIAQIPCENLAKSSATSRNLG